MRWPVRSGFGNVAENILCAGVRNVKQNRDEKHTLLEWKIDFLIFACVD